MSSQSSIATLETSTAAPSSPLWKRIDWGVILVAVLMVYYLLKRPAAGVVGLSNVEDDVYYYIVIARHLLAGHGSTFNGLVATNGYHPLWQLVVLAVQAIAGGLNAVIQLIDILVCCSVLATYVLARAIFRQFIASNAACSLLAIPVAVTAADFLQSGMEIILAVPLALLLILQLLKAKANPAPRAVFGYALLASLTVLARLDAAFFVLLLAICLAFDPSLRRSITRKHVLALLAGFSPLILYFGINLAFFHTLMPLSGQAKQLRSTHFPSKHVFTWYWLVSWEKYVLPVPFIGFAWLSLTWRRIPLRTRAVLIATLLFPFAQFGTLSVLSDWPSWPWYFYSFVIASFAALAILLGDATRLKIANAWGARPLLAALCILAILSISQLQHHFFLAWGGDPKESVVAAQFVSRFAAAHPGTYAMGDRVGAVAAMMGDPIVQTEGLVMDKDFLGHIRRQENLLDVLHHYGVRYYVATSGYGSDIPTVAGYGPQLVAGCFAAREPLLAGPSSPKMQAKLCFPPVATYQLRHHKIWIFDLDQAEKSSTTTTSELLPPS